MIPKFRAWHKEEKRMIDDYEIFIGSDGCAYYDHYEAGLRDLGPEVEIVLSTGLKDKNGIDIHENVSDFMRAYTIGYQVEKPQLFYLKAKELLVVGDYDHVEDLWLDWNKNFTPKKQDAHKFTQQEIDSMETGSYEQIEVAE